MISYTIPDPFRIPLAFIMKKIVFSLFLSVIAINFVSAQVNPVVPLPADQAELFKYTSTPVSMYTGVPQISYPE